MLPRIRISKAASSAILIFILSAPSAFSETNRVAVIKSQSLEPYNLAVDGASAYLKAADPSIKIDIYDLKAEGGDAAKLSRKVSESGAQTIMTVGSETLEAFLKQNLSAPIVAAMIYEPDKKLEGDYYGAVLRVPFERQFKMIAELIPEIKKVSIVCTRGKTIDDISALKAKAAGAGMDVEFFQIDQIKDLMPTIEKASRLSNALLMVLNNELYNSATAKEMLLFSARHKWPIIGFSPNYVKAGALFSISADFEDNGRNAAKIVQRLLMKGTVSERFVSPEKVNVSYNDGVGKAFGVKSAALIREKADQVF